MQKKKIVTIFPIQLLCHSGMYFVSFPISNICKQDQQWFSEKVCGNCVPY